MISLRCKLGLLLGCVAAGVAVEHVYGAVTVSRYRVDDTHNLTLIDRVVQRGEAVHLAAALPAPGLELVTISPVRGRR